MSVVIMGFISWKLTLVVVFGLIPILVITACIRRSIMGYSKDLQDKLSDLGKISTESIQNVRIVKAFASEKHEFEKYGNSNNAVYDIGVTLANFQAAFQFMV